MKIFQRYPLTSYVLVACAWSWLFWGALIVSKISHQALVWKGLFVVALCGPLVASGTIAYAGSGIFGVTTLLGKALRWRVSPLWYVLALALPPLMMFSEEAALRHWCGAVLAMPEVSVGVVGMFLWLLIRSGPVNEEFGWRGFLLPGLMRRHSPFTASLILGPVWAFWHWPLWFLTGVPHRHWPFFLFFVMVLPATVLFTWFYLQTRGSLLIAILFHGSLNICLKIFPLFPPAFQGWTPLVFWIAALSAVAVGVVSLNRQQWFSLPGEQRPGEVGTKAASVPVTLNRLNIPLK